MRRERLGCVAALASVALIGIGCGSSTPNAPTSATTKAPTKAPTVTSAQVVAQFQKAGLPAQDPHPMTPSDYGVSPKLTDDATRFLIPSLGPDSGGRAFVFTDNATLNRMAGYYQALAKQSAAFASWVFVNPARRVLVQIAGALPAAQAHQYQRVVNGL